MPASTREFSPEIKKLIAKAKLLAENNNDSAVTPTHLLRAALLAESSLTVRVLHSLTKDFNGLQAKLDASPESNALNTKSPLSKIPLSSQADRILKVTFLEAKALHTNLVKNEHLVLALLRNKELHPTRILLQWDIDYDIFKAELDYLITSDGLPETPPTIPLPEVTDDHPRMRAFNAAKYHFKGNFFYLQETESFAEVDGHSLLQSISEKEATKIKIKLLQRRPSNLLIIDSSAAKRDLFLTDLRQSVSSDYRFRQLEKDTFYSLVPKNEVTKQIDNREWNEEMSEIRKFLLRKGATLVIDLYQYFSHNISEELVAQEQKDQSRQKHELKVLLSLFTDPKIKVIFLGSETLVAFLQAQVQDFTQRATLIQIATADYAPIGLEEIKRIAADFEAQHSVIFDDEALETGMALQKKFFPDDKQNSELRSILDEVGAITSLNNVVVPARIEKVEAEIEIVKMRKNDAVKNQQYMQAADLRDQESKLQRKLEKARLVWQEDRKTMRFPVNENDLQQVFAQRLGITVAELKEEKQEHGQEAPPLEFNPPKKEQEGEYSISIEGVPKVLLTTLKQYISYFTDYVRDVKNTDLGLAIEIKQGVLQMDFSSSQQQDLDKIDEWLNEYMNFFRVEDLTEELTFENGAATEEIKIEQLSSQVHHLKEQVHFIERREQAQYYLEAYVPKTPIKLKDENSYLQQNDFASVTAFKFHLRQLIGEAKMSQAVKQLLAALQKGNHTDSDEMNSLLSLQRRVNVINQKVELDTISSREANIEMNKITLGLTRLIADL